MENLELYKKVKSVPEEAKKPIRGGRTNGFTDINPMWRIKTLTECFGPCGIGWYYDVEKEWTEVVGTEICAFVNINLYVKYDGEWSKPIHGTGGSKLAESQKSGVYISDECFKMATTDAISVACKQLGIGADVYWDKDKTKYDRPDQEDNNATAQKAQKEAISDVDVSAMRNYIKSNGLSEKAICALYKKAELKTFTLKEFQNVMDPKYLDYWKQKCGAA